MTESMATGRTPVTGPAGEDFVCRACGCEVVVKHWGDPRSHAGTGTFACHCGQQMEREHPDRDGGMGEGGSGFNQEDFLGHGGGVDEASGVDGGSSPASSPAGGR